MSQMIGILYRASQSLNQKAMLTLYHFYIFLSYMTYCIVVWGNTFISNLSSLNIIHKKVVRLISKRKHNNSSINFRKLRVLQLFDIVNFKTAEIVFNAVRNKLPKIFKNISVLMINHLTKTRKEMTFKILKCRTQLKSMCFFVRGT